MKCPKCKLTEMIIKNVNGKVVEHYCRNCGEEYKTEIIQKAQESI